MEKSLKMKCLQSVLCFFNIVCINRMWSNSRLQFQQKLVHQA